MATLVGLMLALGCRQPEVRPRAAAPATEAPPPAPGNKVLSPPPPAHPRSTPAPAAPADTTPAGRPLSVPPQTPPTPAPDADDERDAQSPDASASSGAAKPARDEIEIDMSDPADKPPPAPPFLAIVEKQHPEREARVHATVRPPRKLELDTRNVRRLRLTRRRLPLARNRSIVLRIDGKGIEWTADVVAVELERSRGGEWRVVRTRLRRP